MPNLVAQTRVFIEVASIWIVAKLWKDVHTDLTKKSSSLRTANISRYVVRKCTITWVLHVDITQIFAAR